MDKIKIRGLEIFANHGVFEEEKILGQKFIVNVDLVMSTRNAGLTDEERGKMTALLDSGFTDTFRYFYPDKEGIYSWWSYRFKAREKNAGWRIDYFLTSKALDSRLVSADIHTEVFGSDHCPVELVIE